MSQTRERKFSIFDYGRKVSSATIEMESLAKQMTNLELSLGESQQHEVVGDIVLIGVDGSKAADEALTWYLENLHRRENILILVFALEFPTSMAKDVWDSHIQAGKRKQVELQEKYSMKFKEMGISGEFLSEFEKPGEFIVSSAKKKNVSYIVMASRGMSRSRKSFIGDVSDYVIHNASCPVVMART